MECDQWAEFGAESWSSRQGGVILARSRQLSGGAQDPAWMGHSTLSPGSDGDAVSRAVTRGHDRGAQGLEGAGERLQGVQG